MSDENNPYYTNAEERREAIKIIFDCTRYWPSPREHRVFKGLLAEITRLRAELAALKANDPLNDAANHACGELPEGWMVSVDLERNAATVWLVDPANNYTDVHEDETSISDLVREAIRRAKEGQP